MMVTLFGGDSDDVSFLPLSEGEVAEDRCFTGEVEGEDDKPTTGYLLADEGDGLLSIICLRECRLLSLGGEGETRLKPLIGISVDVPEGATAVRALMRSYSSPISSLILVSMNDSK
jgi:hypothetical protein